MGGGVGAARRVAPARHLRIPESASDELSADLAWLALASKGRVTKALTASIMEHQRRTQCVPAVLIAAVVQYLILKADGEQDNINRYWHLVDQVSARTRARYLYIPESELQ